MTYLVTNHWYEYRKRSSNADLEKRSSTDSALMPFEACTVQDDAKQNIKTKNIRRRFQSSFILIIGQSSSAGLCSCWNLLNWGFTSVLSKVKSFDFKCHDSEKLSFRKCYHQWARWEPLDERVQKCLRLVSSKVCGSSGWCNGECKMDGSYWFLIIGLS